LILASPTSAQPLEEDLEQVQLFFGGITELECCLMINKKTKAPYQGFLLTPYQLVLLKDTLDNWELDLTKQLELNETLCLDKIHSCQDTRNLFIDELKKEAVHYIDLSEKLTITLVEAKSDYKLLKTITYISIPTAIILGAYLGSQL
jgi:hypothetical protein